MELIGKVAFVGFGIGLNYANKVIAPRDVTDGLLLIKAKLGNATFIVSDGTWFNKAIDRVQEEEGRTVIFTYDHIPNRPVDCQPDLVEKCTFIRDTLKQSKVAVIVDGQLFEH